MEQSKTPEMLPSPLETDEHGHLHFHVAEKPVIHFVRLDRIGSFVPAAGRHRGGFTTLANHALRDTSCSLLCQIVTAYASLAFAQRAIWPHAAGLGN